MKKNSKSLILLISFLLASISSPLQAIKWDRNTLNLSTVKKKASQFYSYLGTYTQKPKKDLSKLYAHQPWKVIGVAAAAVALPVGIFFLVKKLRNSKDKSEVNVTVNIKKK